MSAKDTKHIHLAMSHPCSKDWGDMLPDAEGRFCTFCQHKVIDFTGKSDAFIFDTYAKSTEKVCGLFSDVQLNRNYYAPAISVSSFRRHGLIAAAVVCLAVGNYARTDAHFAIQNVPYISNPFKLKGPESLKLNPANDSITVTGVVESKKNGVRLDDVRIYLKSSRDIQTISSGGGHYELKIPKSLLAKDSSIVFKLTGWHKNTLVIKPNENTYQNTVLLKRKMHYWPDKDKPTHRIWYKIGCPDNFGGK